MDLQQRDLQRLTVDGLPATAKVTGLDVVQVRAPIKPPALRMVVERRTRSIPSHSTDLVMALLDRRQMLPSVPADTIGAGHAQDGACCRIVVTSEKADESPVRDMPSLHVGKVGDRNLPLSLPTCGGYLLKAIDRVGLATAVDVGGPRRPCDVEKTQM